MTEPQTFRPKARFAIAAVIALQGVLLFSQVAALEKPGSLATAIFAFIAVNTLVWLLFLRPKIVFYDEHLVIVNPFTEVVIPWGAVQAIDSHFAFSVQVGGKKYSAWAAPAPGRQHSSTLHSSDFKGLGFSEKLETRLSDSPNSDSGAAAYLARTRLAEFRGQELVGATSPDLKFNYLGATILLLSIVALTLLIA